MKWKSFLLCTWMTATTIGQVAPSTPPTPQIHDEMLVSTSWLADHLHDKDLVVLYVFDVKDTYRKAHIPSARYLQINDIAVTRNGIPNELPDADKLKEVFENVGINDRSRIILYGERSGLLAARAYFTLDFIGLGAHTSLLDGGLEKWGNEKRELVAETPKVKKGSITIHAQDHLLVGTDSLFNLVTGAKAHNTVILDARPHNEYTGEKLSEDVTRAGHIPGASSLYWKELIVSSENPVLRPVDELRAIYTKAGVRPESPVITYCRTGVQSSFDYFVAKYLGYAVSMYDASFFDWAREDRPIEKSK